MADSHLPAHTDPAEAAVVRDTVRLAFIAALQLLPPRQRVVLILRDVLAWSSQECAELLDTTAASVNSALARARKTLRAHDRSEDRGSSSVYDGHLLRKYVAAFEDYDVDRMVALLAEDAVFSMPPFELWLRGVDEIERWWRGPGQTCRDARTITTRANGQPAVAVYRNDGGRRWVPFAMHVLDCRDGRIEALTHFMGQGVFAEFGLPGAITGSSSRAP